MAKSERLFDMLRYIREYPHLNTRDLSRLCNVSERGIYRYLNTLSRAGISLSFQEGGYKLPENGLDILRTVDIEALQAAKMLLSIGMKNCEDDELLQHGKNLIEWIDKNLPKASRGMPREIEIIAEGEKVSNYGGTITIGHSTKPSIINPILTSETISAILMNLIFSSLIKFDEALQPVPDLAESWEVSKDGLIWTFFLRDDVRFHDGHPLTAEDVEFTYRSILDPKNMSPMAGRYQLIDKIETDGDYIFRVILKHPFAPFIHWFHCKIAPKHLLDNVDLHNNPFNRRPVGSGPFKLKDWEEDDTIILNANREYFQKDRPILEKLIFKTYPDRKTALEAIAQKKMDMAMDLMTSDILSMNRSETFKVYVIPGASCYAIIFNLKNPLFKDIRVRQALDHAIDKDSIIKNQLKGISKVCTGPFGVNSWAYNPEVEQVTYSIDKAKILLEQAGWVDTNDDGILEKDGEPFEFSLVVPNISCNLERIAITIRAQLMKMGIRVNLVYVDDLKFYETPFQAVLSMIITGADPDDARRFWHSKSGSTNIASYESDFVDALLEQGRQTMDMEERKKIYHKIHRRIHDDCPAIFLASGCNFVSSNYRFKNTKFLSLLNFLTTMKDWQIVDSEGK